MSRTACSTVCLALLLFSAFILSGCGSSTEANYEPGRVFVIDNTRPPKYILDCVVRTWIEYDGRFYYRDTGLPRNMNHDGTCNYLEPIELTEEPLPGGMRVTVTYWFDHMGATVEHRYITLTVDGNITVELYMENWVYGHESMVYGRTHKGKWSGPDPAASSLYIIKG